jgi:NTP pyrophosphatase (non-canonical NTP hydrolase)
MINIPKGPAEIYVYVAGMCEGDKQTQYGFTNKPDTGKYSDFQEKYVRADDNRMAPVQGYSRGIPWKLHLKAYDAYCERYGPQQALIEGDCRGGFSVGELDRYVPDWAKLETDHYCLLEAKKDLKLQEEISDELRKLFRLSQLAASKYKSLSESGIPECMDEAGEIKYIDDIIVASLKAAAKAQRKFPQPNYVALKVAEEAGEVVRAAVHYAEDRLTWKELEGEVVQTIAMLLRLVAEGDQINGVIPPHKPITIKEI